MQPFAHTAVVDMAPDADIRALGGAVTLALCGAWEHQPPCPIAEHHTAAERDGDQVRVRVRFTTVPERELTVRARIAAALEVGELEGPDGVITHWELLEHGSAPVGD
jgi:hypothetical protein